ncbi:MAG: hypothetical protein GEV11_09825 [Streptosporangiales bacterium]|nr:hypothetical protein [Streptosporangiales bacterium]
MTEGDSRSRGWPYLRGELYFRVLGPVTVERAGRPFGVGGPQRRTVLALLLQNAGDVVSTDCLVDALWGDDPPASFRVQLQGVVSELRRALGADAGRSAAPIETSPPGYRLRVEPDQVDLELFRREVAEGRARAAAGEPAAAAEALRGALGRWRGPAFADMSTPALQQAALGLEELRLAALEERIAAEMDLGVHSDLIPELSRLVEEHPLRERFTGQLMTVLAATGRLADALAAYRTARERTVEELGIEPSERLQDLHRSILTGGVPLGAARPDPAAAARPRTVPRQLPPDQPVLVGRETQLHSAIRLVAADAARGLPACVAITGPGGTGKTTFALRLAHRVADDYPDGQLYARLGGAGAGRRSTEAVAARLLHGLGVPPGGVPADPDERAGLLRELLAGRRLLLVLDDAADEAQVRPLLPGEPGCAVLITSRRRLSGLEIAHPVRLAVLSGSAGVELLRRVVGHTRVDAEPRAAAEIVDLCGGLPLALRIAAARLASRPGWRVADMARRLAANRDRLDWLELGDQAVRASLAETYDGLGEPQRRLFRAIGLLRAAEFPAWLPAALLDRPEGAAETLLDTLVDVHLVEPAGRGVTGPRYRVHDLIQLLARELAAGDGEQAGRDIAARVLHGWYDLACVADDRLPHWYGLDDAPPPRWRAPEDARISVAREPLAWLDEERGALLAAVRQAAEEGYDEVAWPLAQRLSGCLDLRGRFDDWAEALSAGLRSAERAGDTPGRICMYGLLVDAESNREHIELSMDYAARTAVGYLELGGEPRPRTGRARLDGGLPEERELLAARAAGDTPRTGFAAFNLALVWRAACRRDAGYLDLFDEAAAAFRACGAHFSELAALKVLGLAHIKARRFDEAFGCLHRAQEVVTELGDDAGMPFFVLGDIPLVYARQGRYAEAETLVTDVLRQARAEGHLWDEGRALDTLGELYDMRGDAHAALDASLRALGVWRRLQVLRRIARTVAILARLCDAIGDHDSAELYRTEHAMLGEEASTVPGAVPEA